MTDATEWKRLGGWVADSRRTGEVVYGHLEWPSRITLNKRRKSAPRDLTQAIRELSRMMRSLGDDNRPGGEKPA